MEVIEKTTFRGGYERVLALKQCTIPSGPVFSGPALVLYAEAEENVLVSTSPTLAAVRDHRTFRSMFPCGTMSKVTSSELGDPVAHASIIFHHRYYNPLLESWYGALDSIELRAVL